MNAAQNMLTQEILEHAWLIAQDLIRRSENADQHDQTKLLKESINEWFVQMEKFDFQSDISIPAIFTRKSIHRFV